MAVTPGVYDFCIYQGATFNPTLTWKDENGTAINLTGYTARMQARVKITDTDPFINLTTENGGITLGGAAGTVALYISAEDTADIADSGVYDLELVSSGGEVNRLLMGNITLSKNVTR